MDNGDTNSGVAGGGTRVDFDLSEELTAEELARFTAAALAAGAASVTEHFLNLTLRPERCPDDAQQRKKLPGMEGDSSRRVAGSGPGVAAPRFLGSEEDSEEGGRA
jgi:hypothetical protein